MIALKAGHSIRWKERIGTIAVGRTVKYFEEVLFDFMLYPAVIAVLGPLMGGLLMSSLSASVCILYIRLYDWSGRDWLGLELLKQARDGEAKGKVMKVVQWAARRGDWVAFIVLCAFTDPFEVTVYMRRGVEQFNGLTARDWKIFWASVAFVNLFWTGLMTFAVMLVKFIFGRICS